MMDSEHPLQGWRSSVSRHRLAVAIVAGIVATHIATVTAFWYPGIGLPKLDFPFFNGFLLVPSEPPLIQFLVGGAYHYVTGICFALIYVYLVHPLLPGPSTTVGNIGKALVWGLILALLSALWWVPVLFPAFNLGVFAMGTPDGWKLPFAIFLYHAVYAVHLGAFYNPLPKDASARG